VCADAASVLAYAGRVDSRITSRAGMVTSAVGSAAASGCPLD
jgi:hypothetical protein